MGSWSTNGCILIFCFFIGGIPFGLIIGKINGIDIRSHGSGNIGATNIARTCGRVWGYLCFILDALKGFFPVLLARHWAQSHNFPLSDYTPIFAISGTVGGHIWSPFLRFKGGKGVATSAGAILAVAPFAVLSSIIVWYIVFLLTRYVSLASIITAMVLPLTAVLSDLFITVNPSRKLGTPVLIFLFLLCTGVILKHRDNIQRLLNGTENRFSKKRM